MHRSVVRLLAGVAALTLVATACGDDDDDTSTPETAATAAPTAAPAPETTVAPAPATVDIVDTAVAAGSFTTLATALEAAGLIETLKGPGPFTVFAPTDEAFAKVPKETLDALLADPEALADVLTYHVVSGSLDAAAVTAVDSLTTVQGSDVAITVEGGVAKIGDATITATDIAASNGIIHVIDTVLLPPAE